MEKRLLEINLISAQGLKPFNGRRLQTYAIAWIDPSAKLRTQIDHVGGENPTWNDKFIFRVTDGFLATETAAVSVEIYAVGYIKDKLVGTVRLLVNNCLHSSGDAPAFTAVQIRRPSGRFHGVLNIGATVIDSPDLAALTSTAAAGVGLRDLMEGSPRRRGIQRGRRPKVQQFSCTDCGESADYSDGADSSTSSSSSSTAASSVLKEWNGIREALKSEGFGLLCGLALQRKIQRSPSDPNFHRSAGSENTE